VTAEQPPGPSLTQRFIAEFLGTGFLVATVIGSGIAATRLSPGEVGLQLLINAVATGAVLVALILTFHPVSAAFNPLVTLVDAAHRRLRWSHAGILSLGQVAGGSLGTVVANLMFGQAAISWSTKDRTGGGLWLGETVATFGLLLVIFATPRPSSREHTVAYAVGGYITAAYWFTSSTSFANPAVTLARTLSDSFAGIDPTSAPMFVLMEAVGAVLAVLTIRALRPQTTTDTPGPTAVPADREPR
jgi:glycerol uptake facilitator-like aquaporin